MSERNRTMSSGQDMGGRRVPLYDDEDIEQMRKACHAAATVLDEVTSIVEPGISTAAIDSFIKNLMYDLGGKPATLGYKGYPASSCISPNHIVNHGIPSERKRINSGDILNIDVTIDINGWFGDSSRMYFCGPAKDIPIKGKRLVNTTYESMMAGIAACRPGTPMNSIGKAIETIARRERFSIVEDFVGHGIGRVFHDAPNVFHYHIPANTLIMEPGMIFTVEPMLNAGAKHVKILQDGWTSVTRDRSLSAQFEHTIVITEDGHEILTKSPKGYTQPPYNEE